MLLVRSYCICLLVVVLDDLVRLFLEFILELVFGGFEIGNMDKVV